MGKPSASLRIFSFKASSSGEPGMGGGGGDKTIRMALPARAPRSIRTVAENQRGRLRGGFACASGGKGAVVPPASGEIGR